MPDFEQLEGYKLLAWNRLRKYRRIRNEIAIRHLIDIATLRLTDIAGATLDPADSESSELLEQFALRRAEAFRKSRNHAGAFRHATRKFTKALRLLRLLEDE